MGKTREAAKLDTQRLMAPHRRLMRIKSPAPHRAYNRTMCCHPAGAQETPIMKRSAFLALLLVLPFSAPFWAQDTLPDGLSQQIRTADGLRTVIERKDPRFVIVDVRSNADYAAGHIPTAINIPDGITAGMASPPPKDKYLVVYCLGGRKSPGAGEKLLADGYSHVFVWGGIVNWPYARDTKAAETK